MDVTGLPILSFDTHALALGGAGGISSTQIAMLGLAVAGLTIVMLSTRRRVRESKRLSPPPARQRYARLEAQSRAGRDLDHVMLELDQLARQVHGRIDTQLAKLEAVMREADQRIEKLSRLARMANGESAAAGARFQSRPPTAGEGMPPTASDVEDSRHAPIYQLADSGMPPIEIARKVGMTTGEINLILALRQTKNEAAL